MLLPRARKPSYLSDTTPQLHLGKTKNTVLLAEQDDVVYKIPCKCCKVFIRETGRLTK